MTVIADSVYAIIITCGYWSPKVNINLARKVRGLYGEVILDISVKFLHVYSHTEHYFNDRLDQLAECCAVEGRYSNFPFQNLV